jgi:hypothetical protein
VVTAVPSVPPVTSLAAGSVRRRGRHLLDDPGEPFEVRVLGPSGPPSLALRLPGLTSDPLHGNEIWRTLTPTTMLAGLRDTMPATQLLDVLGFGRLNGLRFRMSTARPATGTRDPVRGRSRAFGTVCALSTLLCWPGHARAELVTGAARAATAALQHRRVVAHAEAALALRWVVALAERFGDDPMVLAPLLVKLRWFEGGEEFLVPARWPTALLCGDVVVVSGEGSHVVGAGLGTADADRVGFVSGLESRAGQRPADPAGTAGDSGKAGSPGGANTSDDSGGADSGEASPSEPSPAVLQWALKAARQVVPAPSDHPD